MAIDPPINASTLELVQTIDTDEAKKKKKLLEKSRARKKME